MCPVAIPADDLELTNVSALATGVGSSTQLATGKRKPQSSSSATQLGIFECAKELLGIVPVLDQNDRTVLDEAGFEQTEHAQTCAYEGLGNLYAYDLPKSDDNAHAPRAKRPRSGPRRVVHQALSLDPQMALVYGSAFDSIGLQSHQATVTCTKSIKCVPTLCRRDAAIHGPGHDGIPTRPVYLDKTHTGEFYTPVLGVTLHTLGLRLATDCVDDKLASGACTLADNDIVYLKPEDHLIFDPFAAELLILEIRRRRGRIGDAYDPRKACLKMLASTDGLNGKFAETFNAACATIEEGRPLKRPKSVLAPGDEDCFQQFEQAVKLKPVFEHLACSCEQQFQATSRAWLLADMLWDGHEGFGIDKDLLIYSFLKFTTQHCVVPSQLVIAAIVQQEPAIAALDTYQRYSHALESAMDDILKSDRAYGHMGWEIGSMRASYEWARSLDDFVDKADPDTTLGRAFARLVVAAKPTVGAPYTLSALASSLPWWNRDTPVIESVVEKIREKMRLDGVVDTMGVVFEQKKRPRPRAYMLDVPLELRPGFLFACYGLWS